MSVEWANEYKPGGPLMQWMDERLPIPRLMYNAIGGGYEVPRNFNWFYNFGVLAGVALMIQIITGIVLALVSPATVHAPAPGLNQAGVVHAASSGGAAPSSRATAARRLATVTRPAM